MTELVKPQWADAKEAFDKVFSEDTASPGSPLFIEEFFPITEFSTFFGEWKFKGRDVLLHLFPRNGVEDEWSSSRRENDTGIRFPPDMEQTIKMSVDKVWQGDIAIVESKTLKYRDGSDISKDEPVEVSLGSFAVQFQDAKNTVKLVGVARFLDTFCEDLDARLE